MKILVIEDDPLQVEDMLDFLGPLPGVEVKVIQTELELIERLPEIERDPPDLFVIDVMLRWTDPQPNAQAPPREAVEGGRERAGFRCHSRLLQGEATREVPTILYSHFDSSHFERQLKGLPNSTRYLQKDSDLRPLLATIRTLIPGASL